MKYRNKIKAIQTYLAAEKRLHNENILINRHSFTNQIGEWLVETLFEGERAKSGTQPGWDVLAQGKYIQVKTHAKALNNPSEFTAISKNPIVQVDELIIIHFSPDYKLLEFYQLPWQEAVKHIKITGKKVQREELNWSHIKNYRVNLDKLPHQEIVQFFR